MEKTEVYDSHHAHNKNAMASDDFSLIYVFYLIYVYFIYLYIYIYIYIYIYKTLRICV